MVALKWMGSILVIAGCSGIGIYFVVKKSVRLRMLRELERILQYLYGEIEYAAPDMAELLEYLSFRSGAFGEFFLHLRGRILSHEGLPFCEYWKEEMPSIQGMENLTSADREFLVQIGENLGNLDRMTQLATLKIFQRRLSETLLTAEREYHGKAKVCIAGWTIAGVFVAIFLF